jgi:maltose O-acetyltransferase
MKILIRRASPVDAEILTEISFASKRYWNYPESYFEIWQDELTITEHYIQENLVNLVELNGMIVGYYAIVKNDADFWAGNVFVMQGYWLEHIFIRPGYIRKGIGSRLIDHARTVCRGLGIDRLYIFSDPHARGFYERIGASYLREPPSNIEGRKVALFEFII